MKRKICDRGADWCSGPRCHRAAVFSVEMKDDCGGPYAHERYQWRNRCEAHAPAIDSPILRYISRLDGAPIQVGLFDSVNL